MAMPEDIRERLGLDYMKRRIQREQNASSHDSDEYLQDALMSLGPLVMGILEDDPDRTKTVFELVDETGESVATLGPVLDRLRNMGYVDRIEEDRKGDHTVRLTDRGESVVVKRATS